MRDGDTVAIEKSYTWDNQKYWISVDGKVVPTAHTAMMSADGATVATGVGVGGFGKTGVGGACCGFG